VSRSDPSGLARDEAPEGILVGRGIVKPDDIGGPAAPLEAPPRAGPQETHRSSAEVRFVAKLPLPAWELWGDGYEVTQRKNALHCRITVTVTYFKEYFRKVEGTYEVWMKDTMTRSIGVGGGRFIIRTVETWRFWKQQTGVLWLKKTDKWTVSKSRNCLASERNIDDLTAEVMGEAKSRSANPPDKTTTVQYDGSVD
jgi:hypothetical protein